MARERKRGYARRDSGTHRTYNWDSAIKRYEKTKRFNYVGSGSGHKAGEDWAKKKNIDPDDPVTRYGKNSPSFDEGVYKSKQARKKALDASK